MSSALEQLPVELVEIIGACLTLHDLEQLRLVSTTLAHKASGGRIKEAYINSRLDLRQPKRINSYVEVVKFGSNLVSNVRHVTFYHSRFDAFTKSGNLSRKLRTIMELRPLLEEVFAALKSASDIRISSVRLDIQGVKWQTERMRTHISTAIFENVLAVLLKADLPVEAFHTTEQDDHKLTPYFIGLSGNALCLPPEDLNWFHGLRSLSLSLTHAMPGSQHLTTYADRFLDSFTRLLQACDNVHNLRLHWANAEEWGDEEPQDTRVREFFNAVHPTLAAMPSLQTCALDGIYLTETALLEFVSHTNITELVLRGVLVHSGSWQVVFDSILQKNFHKLHLQDLLESALDKQYFIVRFSGEPIDQGCTIFKCTAETKPERLEYATTNNLIMANERRWQAARGQRYGYVPYADGHVIAADFD